MAIAPELSSKVQQRLERIYAERAGEAWKLVAPVLERYVEPLAGISSSGWSEQDAVLITYGDQVRAEGQPALAAQREFLTGHGYDQLINHVHLLPFFPYSSDDGFSVIDYRKVMPETGGWPDVRALGEHFGLAFDLVLNHCSAHSEWFAAYLRGEEPYDQYFIEADPAEDLSQVVRPRSLPLLTPVETSRGEKHVWTTFSADQVDLNFAAPVVLAEMLDVLLFYVTQGARIVRLDAIAYLWKEIGTKCIHLPETHEVVKLIRDVVDGLADGAVWILSETNVPHRENVSYFGNGDEAHMVYQFSLPPLLLDALLRGDASLLTEYLRRLDPPPPGATFFNFTASHDGVGVRPLEGIVQGERFEQLIADVRARGGQVSTKRNADGSDSPYELNISYFSALEPEGGDAELHVRRFLCSQAVMLALQGIPGIYFHSLFGTPNDRAGVEATGRARSINRRKFERSELEATIAGEPQRQVFEGYRRLLAIRSKQPAFHPNGQQEVFDADSDAVLAFRRTSPDHKQRILVLANVTEQDQAVDLSSFDDAFAVDLLSEGAAVGSSLMLAPYQIAWLVG